MHTVLNALVLLTRASSTQELNLNSILLLCRQSASCPLFILLRKFSVIFRNASLLLLLCSSSSPPTPSSSSLSFSELSGNSGSRTFLNFFSSFLTKFTMFSSSSYNSKDKVSKIMYTWVSFKRFGIFWRLNNNGRWLISWFLSIPGYRDAPNDDLWTHLYECAYTGVFREQGG